MRQLESFKIDALEEPDLLASALVEIAKTDGMGWWRRRELLWRMRNYC